MNANAKHAGAKHAGIYNWGCYCCMSRKPGSRRKHKRVATKAARRFLNRETRKEIAE